jgi:GDPmannose 4,6-dehydratase
LAAWECIRFIQVEHLVEKYKPNYIFHLAANSSTRHNAVFDNHESIGGGTLNILEAVYKHSRDTKVYITGSGLQFKNIGQSISENDPFEPSSLYAVSRIYAVNLARYYRSLGLQVYVGYLFHHESPLRRPNHISKKIINAIQLIAKGENETLNLNDISVEKEWTFAGDIVRGIMTLVEQDEVYEATIGSGIGYSIRIWLEICFNLIGKDWTKFVRIEERFRPEYRRLVSDPKTIFALGWQPTVNITELAKMMFITAPEV